MSSGDWLLKTKSTFGDAIKENFYCENISENKDGRINVMTATCCAILQDEETKKKNFVSHVWMIV